MSNIHSPLEAARYYLLHGFYPIPVPFREKKPVLKNWPSLHLTEPQLGDYFNGEHMNIGVLLGAPQGNNDIDLDAFEALRAWPEFAIETGMIWGRSSKPASHWMYRTEPVLATVKFPDPTAPKDQKGMLLELRGPGAQTIMPPSEHPTGEAIEFWRAGDPALVDRTQLVRAARRTAACALLARYLPGEGQRHDFFLAVAGGLRHARWPVEDAAQVLRAIYRAAWGAEADLKRATLDAETTYKSHEQGKNTTGWPSIESMLDRRVLNKAVEWLGIERQAPPEKKRSLVLPAPNTVDEILDADIQLPEPLVEDLFPRRGLVLMTGAQRSGKTIFAAQLAIALATNHPLLDYYRLCAHGPVIVFEKDDPAGMASFKDIYLKAKVPRGTPIDYYGNEKISIPLGQGFLEWLEIIIPKTGAVLVVLDSYTALRPERKNGGDIVHIERRDISGLDQLAKKLNCLILLLHHESITTRANGSLEWDARGAGTYGMSMAAECQMAITRFRELPTDAPERLVRFRSRHMKDHQAVLFYNPKTGLYQHIFSGRHAHHYPLIHEIKRHIRKDTFTAKDLEEALAVSRATAFRTLGTLKAADILWHVKNSGEYRFAPEIEAICIPPL